MKNKLDRDYIALLQDILDNGIYKRDRTGTGTISVFGRSIRHKMSDGFPLLTTKKMAFKTMVAELLWFLKGDTNIKYLIENNCHIWDGDCYKNYVLKKTKEIETLQKQCPSTEINLKILSKDRFIEELKTNNKFSKKWGELGRIYGAQWRSWANILNGGVVHKYENEINYIDQIKNLISDLKVDPDSRRLIVTAWNPSDLKKCVLPPCHYSFQCYTRDLSINERLKIINTNSFSNVLSNFKVEDKINDEEYCEIFSRHNVPQRSISMIFNMRSVDVPLGLPVNISSYGLLLIMISRQVNMIPEELICNLADTHIYKNQIDGVKEQLDRVPYELPVLKISNKIVNDISEYTLEDILLENYQSHPKIFFPLSN